MQEHRDRISEIIEKIGTIASERFASGKTCHLSYVGGNLKEDVLFIREHTGLGLAEFIRANMSDKLTLISGGQFGNVMALWPAGQEYTPSTSQIDGGKSGSGIRFIRELWLGFSLPSRGVRRFFDPDRNKMYEGDSSEGSSWIEIPDASMRKPTDEYDTETIILKIREWLAEHDLRDVDFEEKMPASPQATLIRGAHGSRLGTNALEVVLSALDHRQLHATSLSLDVVEALLRKRI